VLAWLSFFAAGIGCARRPGKVT